MKYLIFMCLVLTSCTSTPCTIHKTILAVGGCSNEGRCGVKYDDGTFGHGYYPVVGEVKTFCR